MDKEDVVYVHNGIYPPFASTWMELEGIMLSEISQSEKDKQGLLGGSAVERLPLAQGAILETRDRIPHQAPGAWSLLLPLPVSLPLCVCVCVCETIINK